MNKSIFVCKQCSFNCQLQIHTWFTNPHIVCPKGVKEFKWGEITDKPTKEVTELATEIHEQCQYGASISDIIDLLQSKEKNNE